MNQNALNWIASDDTGISSKTIWAVMMNAEIDYAHVPWDPADFGRCYRLLEAVPEWKPRLGEVAKKYPAWTGLVENWPELEALYLEELPTGKAPKLYQRMKQLTER